tara:strand:+ start:1432 stop:1767 length:336 start_codon:yes stop_codon:yes gene_type:complete
MNEDYNEVEDNGMSPYIKSSKTIKDDGGVDITLHLTPLMYKSLQHICSDVNMFIVNFVFSRSENSIDEIYKKEIEKHITAGTIKADMTKESLVLNAELPNNEMPIFDMSNN